MDGNAVLKNLSKLMLRLRTERGLSIEKAANLSGVCTHSIWSIEKQNGCNVMTIALIANAYGLTLSELFKQCEEYHEEESKMVNIDSKTVQVTLGARPTLRELEGCLEITLLHHPNDAEWEECKLRALVTQGFTRVKNPPDAAWKHDMLTQRHSPIRLLRYSFLLKGIPSNIATHFARHKHAEPYIGSLRNDRQKKMDGDNAPRNTPVNMIIDMNAEELMTFANKRLCNLAYPRTKEIASEMLYLAEIATPELRGLLVPACVFYGNKCHERDGCGMCPKWEVESNG